MNERVILSQKCISEGLVALAKLEPKFKQAINTVEEIPLRRSSEGFERLLSALSGHSDHFAGVPVSNPIQSYDTFNCKAGPREKRTYLLCDQLPVYGPTTLVD